MRYNMKTVRNASKVLEIKSISINAIKVDVTNCLLGHL